MDPRTILFFLIAQMACDTNANPINRTITMVWNVTQRTLVRFSNYTNVLPDVPCTSLNSTELQHLHTTDSCRPSFCCFMVKMSTELSTEMFNETRQLSEDLRQISQLLKDIEKRKVRQTDCQNCSLPRFEGQMDKVLFTKCLVKLLDDRLHSNTC